MKKILLIDDEPSFCYFIKVNLELTGTYKVLIAPNGKKGLRSAHERHPDLILLDIMMPDLSGFETLKRLKKSQQTTAIPVIMLTAKDNAEALLKSACLYCRDYITKPVKIETLKLQIKDVLSKNYEKYRAYNYLELMDSS